VLPNPVRRRPLFRSPRPARVGIAAALLAAGIVAAVAACSPRGTPRLNLVLVSIDTLRADHLGTYGYARPTTPEIDRFARQAVLFREFISNAPSTLSAHASLLTSLSPSHHGASVVAGTRVWPGATLLADVLSEAGYATASFNGGHQLDPSYGLAHGFDVYEATRAANDRAETLVGPENRLEANVRKGIEWIRGVRRPFFVFLHSYEIHHPYTPAPADLKSLEPEYGGDLPDSVSVDLIQRINAGRMRISPRDLAHVVAAYDAELRSADRAFGELLAFLDESGLRQSTVVVLVSDHGEEFGERGTVAWHSHTLYDELLHVPAVVSLPGGPRGTVVSGQVRGIDLAPTLTAALGLGVPAGFTGRGRGDAMRSGEARELPELVKRDKAREDLWRIRTGRWKLYNADLFDLHRDPAESRDVAGAHPDVVERLRREQEALLGERPIPPPTRTDTDPEVLERLRSLGYVE